MTLFGVVISAGQFAAALTAIGMFLFGCWKIYRFAKKNADKITKTYLSIGEINGDGKTIAENVKDTKRLAGAALSRLDDFAVWRLSVDNRLDDVARTLGKQDEVLEQLRPDSSKG